MAGWPERRFLILYIAPLFAISPIWVRLRLVSWPPRLAAVAAIDAAVFLLSFLRFVSGTFLPFSGHMLFLTYSAAVTNSTIYRALALLLLIVTTWFKLVLWRDPHSWSIGLILGLVAAGSTLWVSRVRSRSDRI